jgi:L-phenylalanine/L-methionine N-acetyltransferase
VITVRRAEPSDASGLVALMAGVSLEPDGWLLQTDGGRSVVEERRYLRVVRRHPDAAVYVAVADDVIVGRLSVARDPHPASRHVADLGLMVAAGHRRKGIGRRLLEQAVAWAGSSDVTKLELHVFPWNEPAIELYEGFGFRREGYRVRHYVRAGEEVDAILMALVLPRDEDDAATDRG